MDLLCDDVLGIGYQTNEMSRLWERRLILEAGHPAHRGASRDYYRALMGLYDSLLQSGAEVRKSVTSRTWRRGTT
jgi:hypothetical protein